MATQRQNSKKNPSDEQVRKRQDPKPTLQDPGAQIQQADPVSLQRAVTDPASAQPGDILNLQRAAGNRAVHHCSAQVFEGQSHRREACSSPCASTPKASSGPPARLRGRASRRASGHHEGERPTRCRDRVCTARGSRPMCT